jgi:hypothetical protein
MGRGTTGSNGGAGARTHQRCGVCPAHTGCRSSHTSMPTVLRLLLQATLMRSRAAARTGRPWTPTCSSQRRRWARSAAAAVQYARRHHTHARVPADTHMSSCTRPSCNPTPTGRSRRRRSAQQRRTGRTAPCWPRTPRVPGQVRWLRVRALPAQLHPPAQPLGSCSCGHDVVPTWHAADEPTRPAHTPLSCAACVHPACSHHHLEGP